MPHSPWPGAPRAVDGPAPWRRIPQPRLWMTQARWHGEGADAGWPLLAEALWLAGGEDPVSDDVVVG